MPLLGPFPTSTLLLPAREGWSTIAYTTKEITIESSGLGRDWWTPTSIWESLSTVLFGFKSSLALLGQHPKTTWSVLETWNHLGLWDADYLSATCLSQTFFTGRTSLRGSPCAAVPFNIQRLWLASLPPFSASAPHPLAIQMRIRPRGRTTNPSVPEPLATWALLFKQLLCFSFRPEKRNFEILG